MGGLGFTHLPARPKPMKSYPILFISSAVGLACVSGQIRQPEQPDPVAKELRLYGTWTVFLHPRYGFELPIPPGVGTSGKPEESHQPQFQSADGNFVMSAWGGIARDLPSKVFADQWDAAQRKADREITYQQRGQTWFVVSGTDVRGIEFYEKLTMQGQHVAFLDITFPKSRIRQYERWVEQIEDGFRPVALRDGLPESPPQLSRGQAIAELEKTPLKRNNPDGLAETPPAPKEEFTFTEPTLKKPAEPKPAPISERVPTAEKAVGKPGFVYSPFGETRRLVDVKGMPSGTKVKCPYTMNIFRVP